MVASSLNNLSFHERARLIYSGTPLSFVITLINGLILYYLMRDQHPDKYALFWFIALFIITCLRLGLYLAYRIRKPAENQIILWHYTYTVGTFIAGCVWGLVSLMLFPAESIIHQAFIAFVIAGMTAGAASTLSASWTTAVAFIVPALLPLIYRFALIENPIAHAMAIMVFLYTLILLASVYRTYQNIQQNIQLRYYADRREHELSQFKSTLDQTLDCVFMFDAKTLRFFYTNQGALDQIGYTREEIMAMHPYDIKPEFNEANFRAFICPLLEEQKTSLTFETLHQHKDGHTVPVEIFLQYIQPANEAPLFVAIVRDITERKRLDRLKDEFVSTVSHELRTPLTSLSGALGLITGGAVGEINTKQVELLNIAQHNSERLLLLINDILDIQKIESGELGFHYRAFELNQLINTCIQDNQSYADKFAVHISFTPVEDDTRVYADPDRIGQVLNNLLSNAVKYSSQGSEVSIHLTVQANRVRVEVTDTGAGIPLDFQDKVFEKFSQSDATDIRRHGGTGLGLAIARSIIEKHHGEIGFESHPGSGSTFYFELPRPDIKTLP
jgi:PAS domain S-box-containing protein